MEMRARGIYSYIDMELLIQHFYMGLRRLLEEGLRTPCGGEACCGWSLIIFLQGGLACV